MASISKKKQIWTSDFPVKGLKDTPTNKSRKHTFDWPWPYADLSFTLAEKLKFSNWIGRFGKDSSFLRASVHAIA
jgi:hypothetical protein